MTLSSWLDLQYSSKDLQTSKESSHTQFFWGGEGFRDSKTFEVEHFLGRRGGGGGGAKFQKGGKNFFFFFFEFFWPFLLPPPPHFTCKFICSYIFLTTAAIIIKDRTDERSFPYL